MSNKNNEKLTLSKFYSLNKEYEELKEKLDTFYRELILKNSNIDLDEVEAKCSYKEVKEIHKMIRYRIEDSSIVNKIEDIMKNKKESEYPEILGVHYYPEILNIESLSDEFKIKLDKILRDAYDKFSKRRELHYLGEDVLNALIDEKILEKEYILRCSCDSIECSSKTLNETRLNEYKDYWKKSMEDEDLLSDEEDEEFNYGCIEIPCWNGNEFEIDSLEAFENYPHKQTMYRFLKVPNLELENL